MRARSKTNRVIDIRLSEEKAYFPGETINGTVLVQPKSSIKVKPIIVKFTGEINLAIKEKEVIQLFQLETVIAINEKAKTLEAKLYKFPFEFTVPDNLPSAMEFRNKKFARIHYRLTAILDRPMVLESLCPKVEYPVMVLEYINVTDTSFVKPQERYKEVLSSGIGRCGVKLSTPRKGYTRGETIPVNIVVNTPQSFVKKDGLVVELIRKIKIQTPRNTFDGEDILKSNKFDLNIIGPYNFAQSITGQLLLRTTPPTIQYKEKLLRINYKIRVHVFGDSKKSPICTVEQSIVVGTWPRADIPIDDDDDEDIIHQMGEVMISDENDDDDGFYYSEIDTKRNSTLSVSPSTINGYTITSPVKRKGSAGSHTSNHSLNSSTSWRSSVSTEPRVNTNLQDPFHRNTHPSMMSFNGYLNRSSSTPDLLANSPVSPTPQLQSRTPVMNPHRTSYYDHTSGHRSTNSIHMSPIHTSFGFSPVEQQHRRVGSDEFNFYAGNIPNYTVPPAPQDPDVPNHTLQPLSSSEPVEMPSPTTPLSQLTPPPPYTPVQLQPHVLEPVNTQMGTLVSESEDDDSDDDDLFAIIEKKKKREERELRRKQRTMYSVPE